MILYHGTNRNSGDQIIRYGFTKNYCSDFGLAVYFSTDLNTANQYTFDNTIIEVEFEGCILDLQKKEDFKIYQSLPGGRTELLPKNIDALKDNNIIAVFNINKLKIIKP